MPDTTTRTVQLARSILQSTQDIDDYHRTHGLAAHSFESNDDFSAEYPAELEQTRNAMLDALTELQELIMGPRDRVSFRAYGNLTKIPVLKFMLRFNILQRVPLDGEISYDELAKETGMNKTVIRQMIRAAKSHRMFLERRPGYISHSPETRLLVSDHHVEDFNRTASGEVYTAFNSLDEALALHPEANDPAKSGWMLAVKATEPNYFLEMAKNHPDTERRFVNSIASFQSTPGYSLQHLTENFPWASLAGGNGSVVDVGGSNGKTAFAIAVTAPKLKIVVQDLPSVVSTCEEHPTSNVTFMPHDFFTPQPIKNADLYLLRWVLHDWPDAVAVQILQNLIPALKPGAKVLVMDEVMPPLGSLPLAAERGVVSTDISMLAFSNAKLRELSEWKDLFHTAGEGFHFEGYKQPTGSSLGLLELTWMP